MGPKAFWPLWVASVAVPLVVFVAAAWWTWGQEQAEARARVVRTVDMLHEHARRAFETQDALLVALQQRLKGMSWDEIVASPELTEFLDAIDQSAPGISALGIIAPDGRLAHISTRPFPPPLTGLSDRDYVQAQQGPAPGRFVGEPVATRVGRFTVFSYSRPRLGADGRPDGGVLWATFRLTAFTDFYGSIKETPGDLVALARDDGTVLACHPLPDPPTSQRVPAISGSLHAIHRAAVAAGGRIVVAEDLSPFDDEPRLYAARRLPDLPVTVVYGLHPSGPRANWLGQVAAMGGVAGGAALVLLWLTSLAAHRARREARALELARAEAERRADAEAALRNSQKLEAIGQLAAGVAHDFRNVLQAVVGGVGLARKALASRPGKVDEMLTLIGNAAGRGTALTDRMLRLARRDDGEGGNATLDPAAAVAAAADLLTRTLGRRCTVRVVGAAGLPALVRGEQGELEAALLNLAVNARDAMPEGGEITVSLAAEEVSASHPAGLRPGRYVRIAVSDPGVGMDAATLRRATEAFFTTKPRGEGTGLGLSSARAFVEGVGGGILLESPGPGQGTTVTLWLPEALP